MPNISIDLSSLKMPKNLTLADLQFHQPRQIDLLIDAEYYWNILCVSQMTITPYDAKNEAWMG